MLAALDMSFPKILEKGFSGEPKMFTSIKNWESKVFSITLLFFYARKIYIYTRKRKKVRGLVVGLKPLVRMWRCGWVPSVCVCGGGLSKVSWSVFTQTFEENHGKLWTARATNATGDWTQHLLSASFEGKTTRSLVEKKVGERQLQ